MSGESRPYRILLVVLATVASIAVMLPVALTYREYGSQPWFFVVAIAPALVLLGLGLQKIVTDYLWQRLLRKSAGQRLEPMERIAITVLMWTLMALVSWLIVHFLAGESFPTGIW